jgi:hypothetical protein
MGDFGMHSANIFTKLPAGALITAHDQYRTVGILGWVQWVQVSILLYLLKDLGENLPFWLRLKNGFKLSREVG